jgi:phosphate transport system substrate-binding protein
VIGKELLNYRILEKLGVGGQGAVYKALNTNLNRTVVIKVLPPELTVKPLTIKRFKREAHLASALDHPNICAIYDYNFAEGVHFIAMQYVEGKNVRELVNGRPLELKSALSIAVQVCDALAAAHGRGIIHRDIKANNIMITGTGQAKVLDFGLAKLMDDEAELTEGTDRTHLTEIGVPYGTATYAAPEQARGEPADHRADIFSTGILLYEMLTGIWAFQGKTTVEVRYAVMHETPKPLSEARPEPVPSKLQEILDRALAKDPRDRYQNISELRDELRIMLHDISLAEDPTFIEEVAPAVPRHLGGAGASSGFFHTIKAKIELGSIPIALIGLMILGLIALPLWYLLAAKSKPNGAVPADKIIIRLNGSNTIGAKLAPSLAEEFFKRQGAKEVSVLPGSNAEEVTVLGILPGETTPSAIEIRSHGSATAFTDIKDGKSDIGLSSRKIKPDEVQNLNSFGDMTSPASEHILALDGIAVIVNRNNPIDALTKEQIAEIFSGKIISWSQVLSPRGQIKVYARDEKSGTFDSFTTLVLNNQQITNAAVRFEDSIALSEAVARDPDGIGFVGLPYIKDAKAVTVSEGDALPLLPNRLTVATEDYILSRRLYLYTTENARNQWVRLFVDFALSEFGQEIVSKSGFIAQTVASERPSIVPNAPDEYKNLTKGADRLSLNFRFRKGGKDLDNKALTDLDRVVNFVTELKLSGQNLLLLGFADDGADSRLNLDLSKERATVVANHLTRRGITPVVVTGFGSNLPVASGSTEEGREKNRRVELWLKRQ